MRSLDPQLFASSFTGPLRHPPPPHNNTNVIAYGNVVPLVFSIPHDLQQKLGNRSGKEGLLD